MSNTNLQQYIYPSRIDFSNEKRSEIVGIINGTLATTLDLKTQVKQAHWNVKGMDFYQLHQLFDEIAGELEEYIDMFAERITALGGLAMGTARVAASDSILPEYPYQIINGKDHVMALAERFAIYAKLVRAGIDKTEQLEDADTADLYTEVSRTIDKRLWFLEAHLQPEEINSSNGEAMGTKKADSIKI